MSYRVVLGVSGSVAAYRAADLARDLMRNNCEVRVCLTDAAQQFVTPALFEALTGQPCLQDTFEEPTRGRMAHIDWARQADLVMIAPASANTLAKLAHGEGDDMLTTLALAYRGPMLVAPAMNPAMFEHPATQQAMAVLQSRGALVVEPSIGDVACGENGQGKLASVAVLAEAAVRILRRSFWLDGKKVLITGGPTHEPIDDVRYIGNRSSGKMALALAHAATLCGAEVTLVIGPTSLPIPVQFNRVLIQSALEMHNACLREIKSFDGIIGCAAVADYRPKHRLQGKRRRSDEGWNLELVSNPDIIADLAAKRKPGAWILGFAAEPTDDPAVAREKIVRKGLDGIVFNDISRDDIGFGSEDNDVRLMLADGREAQSGMQSKLGIGLWLFERLHELGLISQ